MRWLHFIGENSQPIIDDVLSYCAGNPDALAYYLKRAKEVPAQDGMGSDPVETRLVTCKTCQRFESDHAHGGGAGVCKAGVMPSGLCHWADAVHVCGHHSFRNKDSHD